MKKPTKNYVPRDPKSHALFGVKYAKYHMMMTNRWPASSLNAQFKVMVDLLRKNFEFLKYETKNENRQKRKMVKRLKAECHDGRKLLILANRGDNQRVKNLLQSHRDMQRLYVSMPTYLVVENINQRTFVKRKERDRLQCLKKRLMAKFEDKLMEFHRIQDQEKYESEKRCPDEIFAKKLRKDLTNSETRLKAVKTIHKAYTKLIQILEIDAIYYQPILDSLEADVREQENFIREIIELGLPAISRYKQLAEEYRRLEDTTRKRMQLKMSYLIASRRKAQEDAEELKQYTDKAEGARVDPRRYNRETTSMTKLKRNLEDVTKTINKVKTAILCSRASCVYPVMKKLTEDNDRLTHEVKQQEKERDILIEKENRAEVKKFLLTHNMTEQEEDRVNTIADLRESILAERKKQKETEDLIKRKGELIINIKFSVYNIIDVLRHVGKSVRGALRVYPDPDLKLPLLKFEPRVITSIPPLAFEEDVEKLIDVATTKVRELMRAYAAEKTEKELLVAKKEYEKQYVKNLLKEDELEEKEPDRAPLIETVDRADPNVPTRKQIKAISAKIVEENSKKDD